MTTFSIRSALIGCALLVTTPALGETWQFSSNEIDSNYHAQNARLFAEDVARLSNGALTIDVVSNAALLSRTELKRGVQRGVVPIGDQLIGALANDDPIYGGDSIPLLARDFDEAHKLWMASKPFYDERLAKDGLMVLWAQPWPGQGIYMNKVIEGPEAFEGLKFRAYSPVSARFVELLGAIPTTIPSAEISQAFSTGVVEGMITSPTTGVDSQSWDFITYFYDMQIMTPKSFILVNKAMFEALPDEVQAAVLEAAVEAEKRGWEMAIAAQTDAVETLRGNGMIIDGTPEGMRARLAEIGEVMLNEWIEAVGPDGEKIVRAYRGE